jgi:F-type H+-transporting ATPase subunit c
MRFVSCVRFVLGSAMFGAFGIPSVAHAAPEAASGPHDGTYAVAMVVGAGLAALGCGIGQGKAIGAAMDGLARNPGAWKTMSTPFIMGIAFVEALTLFVWVLAILVYGQMGR